MERVKAGNAWELQKTHILCVVSASKVDEPILSAGIVLRKIHSYVVNGGEHLHW